MLLIQGKFDDARKLFSRLRDAPDASSEQRYEAILGYAEAQLGRGQNTGAADTVSKFLVAEAPASIAAKGYVVWGKADLAEAGSDTEKLQWAAIRFLRGAVLSGNDANTHIAALEGARDAFEQLGNQDRVDDLNQRIARLK